MGLDFSDPRCIPVATGEGPSRTKTCPVCGKTYAMSCRETEWAYRYYASRNKQRYICVCSYGCLLRKEREQTQTETAPNRAHTPESRQKQRESLRQYMVQHGGEIMERAKKANLEKMTSQVGKRGCNGIDGWKIANTLIAKNMTQKQLAEQAGICQATISAYLNGKQKPRREQLERLAAALGIEPDELLVKG